MMFGYNDQQFVRKQKDTAFNPKNTVLTVKHEADSIMSQECLDGKGTKTEHIMRKGACPRILK